MATRIQVWAAGWGIAGTALVAWGQGAEPVREGEAPHRAQTAQLELKPFPASNWSLLSDWKHGPAVSATDYQGKVALIFTWSDFAPSSKPALALAQRLAEQYSKDGLIVIGAHSARGWAEADKPAGAKDAFFRLAHDEKGDFRKALISDGDPDFYLIDRAGQLRFADITTDSVEGGVQLLLAETPDKAGGTKERIAADAAARDVEARKLHAGNERADLTNIPEQTFTPPTPEQYAAARWPKLPRDAAKQDEIAYLEPRPVTVPDADWFPRKPELKGRIVVLYFFHPNFPGTYYEAVPIADRLQRMHGRNVVVVGVATAWDQIGNNERLLKEDKDPDNMRKALKKFVDNRKLEHFLVLDAEKSLYNEIFKENTSQTPTFPLIAIVSSDAQCRWWRTQAEVNGEAALLQLLQVDPGVKARQAAEEAYIRKNGGR